MFIHVGELHMPSCSRLMPKPSLGLSLDISWAWKKVENEKNQTREKGKLKVWMGV
jgi:hypothetical protein